MFRSNNSIFVIKNIITNKPVLYDSTIRSKLFVEQTRLYYLNRYVNENIKNNFKLIKKRKNRRLDISNLLSSWDKILSQNYFCKYSDIEVFMRSRYPRLYDSKYSYIFQNKNRYFKYLFGYLDKYSNRVYNMNSSIAEGSSSKLKKFILNKNKSATSRIIRNKCLDKFSYFSNKVYFNNNRYDKSNLCCKGKIYFKK